MALADFPDEGIRTLRRSFEMYTSVSRGLAVGDLFNSGNVDVVVEDLVVDKLYSILEGQGIVPAEKIRSSLPVKP